MNYNNISKVKDEKTLNLMKESFERDFENQKKSVETIELANYMASKKFGFIKEAFENMSSELFKTKEGRSIINKYIACIKESEELKKMHLLYECIRKAGKDIDVNSYLNEATTMIGDVDQKSYKAATKKLGSVLKEACERLGKEKVVSLDIPRMNDEKTSLDEAVDYIGTHKKTIKTLPEYTECYFVIKEHINLNETTKKISGNSLKESDIEKTVNEFNEKYGNELEESSQKLVKELLTTQDKQGVFDRYKNECITRIKEKQNMFESEGDKMSSERLGVILEKVEKKLYNAETVSVDVSNLIEMTNSLV